MVNTELLREKIEKSGISVSHIANAANVDRSTLYRRLNTSGEGFTVAEATAISKVLNLTTGEVASIFFADIVA